MTQTDDNLPNGITIDNSLSRSIRSWRLVPAVTSFVCTRSFWREVRQLARRGLVGHLGRFIRETARVAVARSGSFANKNFDIYYSFWFTGEIVGLSLRGGPHATVARAHGFDLYEEREVNGGYIPYRATSMELVDSVILLSEQARQYAVSKYPNLRSNLYISSLGVAAQPAGSIPTPEAINLLSCAYPSQIKRLDRIAELAAALARSDQSRTVTWHHYGGTASDLVSLGIRMPTSPNLTIKAYGPVPNEAVLEHYRTQSVTLFVNLSEDEGQPVSMMEAMAFGVPAIAPRVGGIPEMLSGGGGILVNPDAEISSIASEIHSLVGEQRRYAEMRSSAQRTQREKYNAAANHSRIADLFEALATPRSR